MNALLRAAGLSIAALGLFSGCNDDKTTTTADAGVEDAGSQKPILTGKLGAAVAAAEAGSGQAAAPKAPGDGPPEAGFFPPGGADKAQPPGAPTKIEVLSEGADPKVQLVLSRPSEQHVRVMGGYRAGGQQGGLPVFEYGVSLKTEKAKGKDEKEAKSDAMQVMAKVTEVTIPGAAGKLPKELADGLDRLKGGEIRYQLTPEGVMLDLTLSPPKEKEKDKNPEIGPLLELAMRGLVETLTQVTIPLPNKPVGVGGYWIATDRSTTFGIEVVRYRVFKVQNIEKDQAILSVDTRQYAVKEEIDLGAIAQNQKITAERFDSQGKGTLTWKSAEFVSSTSELTQRTQVAIGGGPGGPKGGAPKGALMVELSAKTSAPEKSDKKK
jgi:hypothetical protein